MAEKETVVIDSREPREPAEAPRTRLGVGTGIVIAALIIIALFLLLGGLRPLTGGSNGSTSTPTAPAPSSSSRSY